MLRLLFLLTVFGSLVTQIPGFIERGWDAPLKFLWLVTFACMMLFDTQSALDRRVRFLYLYLLPFLFYCALMTASTASLYLNVDVTNMLISVMVCLTSYIFFLNFGSERLLSQLGRLLLAGALLLGIIVYVLFFRGQDLLTRTYAFDAKNSMGQILLCCAVVGGLFWRPTLSVMRWTKYAIILTLDQPIQSGELHEFEVAAADGRGNVDARGGEEGAEGLAQEVGVFEIDERQEVNNDDRREPPFRMLSSPCCLHHLRHVPRQQRRCRHEEHVPSIHLI